MTHKLPLHTNFGQIYLDWSLGEHYPMQPIRAKIEFGSNIVVTRAVHELNELDRYKAWEGNSKAEVFGFKGVHSDLKLFGSK